MTTLELPGSHSRPDTQKTNAAGDPNFRNGHSIAETQPRSAVADSNFTPGDQVVIDAHYGSVTGSETDPIPADHQGYGTQRRIVGGDGPDFRNGHAAFDPHIFGAVAATTDRTVPIG
jgi:hypothetical protein